MEQDAISEEERLESFINNRLGKFPEEIKISKTDFAKFCLKEIDEAFKVVDAANVAEDN